MYYVWCMNQILNICNIKLSTGIKLVGQPKYNSFMIIVNNILTIVFNFFSTAKSIVLSYVFCNNSGFNPLGPTVCITSKMIN